METAEFRTGLVEWLDGHVAELVPRYVGEGTLDEQMAQLSRVKRALFDAGWMRWGWPESVGGLGGPSILRAVLGEEVTARGLVEAGFYSMTEVLAPTLAEFAPPELAREEIPKLLRGDTMWCQGFSEPGTGSDLSSLSCRATQQADHWVVNGQKLWTSLAQHASACVLLTRTGPPGSAAPRHHRVLRRHGHAGDHRAPVRAAQRRPRVRRGVLRRRRRARRPHPR